MDFDASQHIELLEARLVITVVVMLSMFDGAVLFDKDMRIEDESNMPNNCGALARADDVVCCDKYWPEAPDTHIAYLYAPDWHGNHPGSGDADRERTRATLVIIN